MIEHEQFYLLRLFPDGRHEIIETISREVAIQLSGRSDKRFSNAESLISRIQSGSCISIIGTTSLGLLPVISKP